MRAGWLNAIPGFAIVIGQVSAGALSAQIGKARFQCMTVLTIGGGFLAGNTNFNVISRAGADSSTSHGIL